MNFKFELERRDKINNQDNIIGTEIKNRRLSMSLTLAALAEDTCSTSYLCKIEKAKIVANNRCLEEICKRVGMDKTEYNDLINLKNALKLVCDYYFYRNNTGIEKLKKSINDFNNYRSHIINYVIALYENNSLQANRYSKAILSLVKEITDLDLLVFLTFYSIDLMQQNQYSEASDNIKAVLDKPSGITTLEILQMECLFECAYRSDAYSTYIYYEKLRDLYFQNSLFDQSQMLFYKMAIYTLIKEKTEDFNLFFDKVNSQSLKYNLTFYKSIGIGEVSKVKKMNPDKLNLVAKMMLYFYFDRGKFKQEYTKALDEIKYYREKAIISYLNASIKGKRVEYLYNEGLKQALEAYDGAILDYYLDELANLLQNQGSYLGFFEFYREVSKIKKVINQI